MLNLFLKAVPLSAKGMKATLLIGCRFKIDYSPQQYQVWISPLPSNSLSTRPPEWALQMDNLPVPLICWKASEGQLSGHSGKTRVPWLSNQSHPWKALVFSLGPSPTSPILASSTPLDFGKSMVPLTRLPHVSITLTLAIPLPVTPSGFSRTI